MPDEPIEIGRFGFGIRLLQFPDGRMEWQTQSANENVPPEIVIMLLRAFLRSKENEYFDSYDKNTSSFKTS